MGAESVGAFFRSKFTIYALIRHGGNAVAIYIHIYNLSIRPWTPAPLTLRNVPHIVNWASSRVA